jgi:hypothetical protein
MVWRFILLDYLVTFFFIMAHERIRLYGVSYWVLLLFMDLGLGTDYTLARMGLHSA